MGTCASSRQIVTQDGDYITVVTLVPPPCDFIVFSESEASQLEAAANNSTSNPLVLSYEDGLLVSAAVASVWCLAWAFKAIRSVLDGPTD